jgi:DNA-binding LytR/AlgR family response regulator
MDLARRNRKLNPATQLVFITAYTDVANTAYIRQVAVDYVPKPIDIDELVGALNRCRDRIAAEKKRLS